MDSLNGAALALALLIASPVQADPVAQWRPYIAEASVRFGIPAEWIEQVMLAESAGMTMLDRRPIASRDSACHRCGGFIAGSGDTHQMAIIPTRWE